MKKIYCILWSTVMCFSILLLLSLSANAQLATNYTFTQETGGSYVPITDSTMIAHGAGLDNQVYPLTLPFSFYFDNVPHTQIYVGVNGYISLGNTNPGSGHWMLQSAASGFRVISGFDGNLASSTVNTSDISYKVTGSAPNRKFIVQWSNLGYYASNLLNLNFQIILEEGNNLIEMSYGNTTLGGSSSNLSIQVGLRGLNNTVFFNRTGYSGSWDNTSQGNTASANIVYQSQSNLTPGIKFKFNAPPYCLVSSQPTNLTLTPGLTNVNISYTAPTPAPNKYLIVRTPNATTLNTSPVNGTAYTIGSALGNGTVVYYGVATNYNNTGLQQITNYTYTVFPANDVMCMISPTYNTVNPLTSTIMTAGPKTYTWVPTSGTADWTVPSNWSPQRFVPLTNDTLVFNNGGTVTASNIPTASVKVLAVIGNTTATFTGSGYLTVADSLQINSGSTLNLDGTATLAGYGKGFIVGELNIKGSSTYRVYNTLTTVTGSIKESETGSIMLSSPSVLNFAAGGQYIHARNGGSIPNAVYHPASTVNVTGMTNTSPTITAQQEFGNFEWNCTAQTTSATWNSKIKTIKGNLSIFNTNSHTLVIGSGSYSNGSFPTLTVLGAFIQHEGTFKVSNNVDYLVVKGNLLLNAGTFDFSGGGLAIAKTTIWGNIIQQPSHFITAIGTNGIPEIILEGNTVQNLVMAGYYGTSPIHYTLNNLAGAVLTDTIPMPGNAKNTILTGKWSGSGRFKYSGNSSKLIYNSAYQLYPSAVEWPEENSPANLETNITAFAPANQLAIPGNRALTGTYTMNSGVLVLNNYNLECDNFYAMPSDSTNYIKADSTGYLITAITPNSNPNSVVYDYFLVGGIRNGLNIYVPITLQSTNNTASRKIGVRLTLQQHPNDTATQSYFNMYWSFIDNGTTPFNYNLSLYHPGSETVGTQSMTLQAWNSNVWKGISSTLSAPGGDFSMINPRLWRVNGYEPSVNTPLNGVDITAKTVNNATYVWTGSSNSDYQVPGNWSPTRQVPQSTDKLLFNSGLTDTVKNIPSETVTQIKVTNNTVAVFQSAVNVSSSNSYYGILSDNDSSTAELDIDSGATLLVNGALHPLRITFGNFGSTAKIKGRLEFVNTAWDNTIDFNYCAGEVTSNGVIAAGTTNGLMAIKTPDNLSVNGTFEHKYTSANGSNEVPNCNFSATSVIKILGITTSQYISCTQKPVGKLIYNCPNQTSMLNFGGRLPVVRDSLIIISTGTGTCLFSGYTTNLGYNADINHYYQSGGIVALSIDNYTVNQNIKIHGSFTQTGGVFKTLGYDNNLAILDFDGANGPQEVSFYNNAPSGPITYKISNPTGIYLTGTGNLNNEFKINKGGGIHINTSVGYPINTNLALVYSDTNSTLTYSGNGNLTADTVVFPVMLGPKNLTIGTSVSSILHLPFDRTISGVLKLNGGDINIGANQFVLGNSTTTTGSLISTSGFIRSTGGYFTRWFGTSGLPTSTAGYTGLFPLGHNNSSRTVGLYFSTATALLSGGTISARHNAVIGNTSGLSITDGAYTVNDHTNSNWTFSTGNGIQLISGTIGMQIAASDLLSNMPTPADLRIVQANSTVGQHQNGAGVYPSFMVNRTNLTLANLSAEPLYIGSAAGNIGTVWTSIASGNWSDGTTWDQGTPPIISSAVVISNGTYVSTDTNLNLAKSVKVHIGGTLNSSSGMLTISEIITNLGSVLVNGGTLKLGPDGGGKAVFSNSNILSVVSGILNINGNLTNTTTSFFEQTGGHINIDGNAGGVAALSVGSTSSLLNFQSSNLNLQAGNLVIVDPQFGTIGVIYSGLGDVKANQNHNLIFGNGISTDNGNNFHLNTTNSTSGNLTLGNVIVNGSSSGNNRRLRFEGTIRAGGDFTVNNTNGYVDMNDDQLLLYGNITVNANAFFAATGRIDFLKNDTTATATKQIVSGAGTIKQSPTASSNFRYINIANNVGGVVLDIGDVIVEYITSFSNGLLDVGANTIDPGQVQYAGPNTGWIVGKFKQTYNSAGTINKVFHIGDTSRYTPITIAGMVSTGGSIIVSTTSTDHPQIITSPFNPSKTVNRYFTIEYGGNLAFAPNSISLTPLWVMQDIDVNADASIFFPAMYVNNNWTLLPVISSGTNGMFINSQSNINGSFAFGTSGTVPVISSQPLPQNVCAGSNATFHTSAAIYTSFQWQANSGAGWIDLTDNATINGSTSSTLYLYNVTIPMNGSEYRCVINNAADSTITSAALLSVGNAINPSLTISANQPNPVCATSTITFTGTPTNGGNSPQYQWKKNATDIIGATNATYSGSGFANGDIISCTVSYSSSCFNTSAISNSITLSVFVPVTPTVTISSDLSNSICGGALVTFSALTVNAGSNPVYQWKKNGVDVGTNAPTFATAVLVNNDVISCVITPTDACTTVPSSVSNTLTMTVNTPLVPSITIALTSTQPLCLGVPVAFLATALNGGASPSYQWKKNGNSTGTNSATYTDASLINGDMITCDLIVTPSAGDCYASTIATSNVSVLAVNSSITPSVSLTANSGNVICDGQSVTFDAAVINGGTTPIYQWQKNNINTGTNASTYTDASLINGDVISCTVTYSSGCYLPANSNAVTMTVHPVAVPTLTINAPQTTICDGTSVTFTAMATNGGVTPTYQWRKNGLNVGGNSLTYTDALLVNGDVITALLTSDAACATPSTVSSNNLTITVSPILTPALGIVASQTIACSNSPVTFTATPINGGTSPAYQWKVNGGNTGTNTAVFTVASLNNGDIVSCTMTSNAACVSAATAESNFIPMTINALLTPSITIAATGSDTICQGTSLSFTAVTTNEGSSPGYQWKVNNLPSGTNSASFATTALNNGDVVTCELTSIEPCVTAATAVSNDLVITVNPMVSPAITISSLEGDTICANTTIEYAANIAWGGDNPIYQWKKNGVTVGTNTSSYTENAISDGDAIACVLISNIACASVTEVVSNTLNMTVFPVVTPSVTITATPGVEVSVGTNVIFTANTTNGGDNPVFQWKKNGTPVGTNATTYSSNSLSDGDVITVTLVSDAPCGVPAEVISNALKMNITTVSVDEVNAGKLELTIFPNPTKHKVHIKMSFHDQKMKTVYLELQTVVGQTVIYAYPLKVNKQIEEHELSLPPDLSNGTYLLRIYGDGFSCTRKIIVEK